MKGFAAAFSPSCREGRDCYATRGDRRRQALCVKAVKATKLYSGMFDSPFVRQKRQLSMIASLRNSITDFYPEVSSMQKEEPTKEFN